ncbi:MAG: ABC transporter ATP-binding protein [Anaerolineae bacterium]|jgi:ATP-binding cassette subfamily B protein
MKTMGNKFDFKRVVSDKRLVGLWRMLSGYKLAYVGAVVGVGLASLLQTGNYLLLRIFVDDVLPQKGLAYTLPLIGAGFVGLALLQGVFSFLSGKWASQTAEGIARRLRDYLYDHIQRLTFTYHDGAKTGDLIQRVTSDLDAVRRFYAEQAIGLGRIVLLFVVNFVALLNLNVRLGLISVVVAVPITIVSVFFFKKMSKTWEHFQQREAELSTTLQENLTGVRVVKAFARQVFEMDKFEENNMAQFKAGRGLVMMHAFFWPSTDILCAAQMLTGFFIGALMTINGEITVGTYLAYAGLVVWVIWPLRNLGRIIVQTSTGLVSFGRVLEILKQDREPVDEGTYLPEGDVRGEIVFDGVSFRYDGEEGTVLEDISFSVEPGQAVALLGSTGSGKTSLVNLLPRFYEVSDGRLTLDGVELKEYPRSTLRRQIGIVEQEPFLFSRTIRENITYGVGREVAHRDGEHRSGASDEEVEEAAKAAAIHDVILSFPKGYDTLVGEKGVTLSGGQKQRVAIARTLLKDPRILILDDATSSVDTETEGEIRAALQRLMKGRTTFIIAHRIQSVMNADLILVLDRGKIVQRGTHEVLMAEREGIYRRIYDVQARIEDELQREVGEGETLRGWEAPEVYEREVAHVAV